MSPKMYRALIRIVSAEENHIKVVIPGWSMQWSVHKTVTIPKENLPPEIVVSVGKRLHAKVNLGAENPEDIEFSEWESE
jgi:hypothetical protein